MVTHGLITIFRMTNAGDTEESILTDKIEFDGDAQVPDNKSGVMSYSISPTRRDPDNPLPHSNETDRQDAGFGGNTYTLDALYIEDVNSRALGIAKLRDWIREDQTIDGIFDKGRFGIRNDVRPEYNLTPNNDSGYKIIASPLRHDLHITTFVSQIITLQHSGEPSRFGL